MATKRGKSQARRNGSSNSGMPGWAWLVIGLALGVGIFLLAPKFLDGKGTDSFFRPKPNADAQPPAMDAVDDEPIVSENGTPTASAATATTTPANGTTGKEGDTKEQDYDFYTLLPAEEVALSDTELAARARAEAAERRTTEKPVPAPNPDAADIAIPPAIDTPKPPANTVKENTASTKPPVEVATATVRDDARYLLQAGAFAASGDAEALKAKIAFLGLGARVESAQIKGNTVYRVRMGPYGSATELAEAKRKLSGGGLPAMAIKVK